MHEREGIDSKPWVTYIDSEFGKEIDDKGEEKGFTVYNTYYYEDKEYVLFSYPSSKNSAQESNEEG